MALWGKSTTAESRPKFLPVDSNAQGSSGSRQDAIAVSGGWALSPGHPNSGNDNKDAQPTDDEINAAWIDWKTKEQYKLLREAEYPNWKTQLEYIYDNGLDKWKTDIVDPVKAKYPKPE